MNERLLCRASFALSLIALLYAGWVQCRSVDIAKQAVEDREAAVIKLLAPHMRDIAVGFGVEFPESPARLEDLFRVLEDVGRIARAPLLDTRQKEAR
jgi:hypothetical protein